MPNQNQPGAIVNGFPHEVKGKDEWNDEGRVTIDEGKDVQGRRHIALVNLFPGVYVWLCTNRTHTDY